MKFEHDEQADAIYIYLSEKPYVYGIDLDDERRIDYANDNTPIGIELLCVSKGINLDSLPHEDEIAGVLQAERFKTYVMERQQSMSRQGYSAVFNVKLASLHADRTEKPSVRLTEKEEVTA